MSKNEKEESTLNDRELKPVENFQIKKQLSFKANHYNFDSKSNLPRRHTMNKIRIWLKYNLNQ
jgi:hypothetical protein